MNGDVGMRAAFSAAASSVWVITTVDPNQPSRPVGFTAVSVVSVSIEPAMVSFNVSARSSSLGPLQLCERFAAHLLGSHQEELSRRFAANAAQRFADATSWSWHEDGSPDLVGAICRVAGTIHSWHRAGDSFLMLGNVESAALTDGFPLLHHNRRYLPLADHPIVVQQK